MLTVHLRINDAATGKPTPVRLRISGPDGTAYAPFGRFATVPAGRNEAVGGHLRIGHAYWCYVDGSCEVQLPAGTSLRVQATKGPEYRPLDETVILGAGQMALRFNLMRVYDWRASSHHPGDVRCHFLSPHAALLEAMAEDLDVVNVLATPFPMLARDGNTYTTVSDLLAFSGQRPALTAPRWYTVAVNTLNVHPALGRVGLLHAHRPVFPLTFGGHEETDDWSICDWCDQCHRKGGLTLWVDAFESLGGIVGGEALLAAILGKIDVIEIDPGPRLHPLLPWVYRLWEAGVMVPLAGGSGKDSNRVPLGAMRTYARVGRPGESELGGEGTSATADEKNGFLGAWIDAVRGGRTFVTAGPLFEFDVDGHPAGDVIDLAGPITIRARAKSLVAFERLEVIANGTVIATAAGVQDGDTWSADLQLPFVPATSSWVAARCVGKDGFAHVSPVIVRVDGQPLARRPEAVAALRKLIEQTREWAEQHGRYEHVKRREQLLARCNEAVVKLGTSA